MKYYEVTEFKGNRENIIRREFKTRNEAVNYMFARRHSDTSLNYEHKINGDKHNIEYVCENHDRFSVRRYTL